MKKLILAVAAVVFSTMTMATDIWTGSKTVTWSNAVEIAATQFASASAKAGDKIVVHYSDATDGIEFKVMNANLDHLAGSREAAWISGNGTYELFLTPAAAEDIKASGLQIVGNNFTCTKVELNEGKTLKDCGLTIWTGYFWVDGDWKTLEIYKEAYNQLDLSQYSAIRFYSEANRDYYVLNFLKGWEEGEKFADQNGMTRTNEYFELTLTDELRNNIKSAGHWMVQLHQEGGSNFNFTDIVLVPGNYSRTVNTAYTMLCLPFEAQRDANIEAVYSVEGVSKSGGVITGVVLSEVSGNLLAGTPYIVKTNATSTSPVTLSLSMSGAYTAIQPATGLVGTYSDLTFNAADFEGKYFLGADGKLHQIEGSATVKIGANKAYFDLSGVEEASVASAPGRLVLPVDGNQPIQTALVNQNESERPVKFIQNGQLMIRCGNRVYNVFGM